MRKALLLAAAALLLASCESEPKYTYPPPQEAPLAPQPSPRPNQPSYAAPTPVPRVVRPLHMGMLTAKNVGDYMDREENELRVALHGSGAGVMRPGDAMIVYLRDDVLFEPNSLALSARGTQILSAVAAVIQKYDSTALAVNGYTDTSGAADRNLQLSEQRATEVSKSLVDAGVDAHRIETHGFGATHLRIPTGASVGEPRNRRVEIVISPKMAG